MTREMLLLRAQYDEDARYYGYNTRTAHTTLNGYPVLELELELATDTTDEEE